MADFFRMTLTNYEEGTGWDLDASCFEGRGTFGAPAGTWDIRGLLITRDDVSLAGLSADGPELTEVRPGETIVFDPFVGSGTTLVASEQLERTGYGIEIAPKYVAVTLERLSKMGIEPRLTED